MMRKNYLLALLVLLLCSCTGTVSPSKETKSEETIPARLADSMMKSSEGWGYYTSQTFCDHPITAEEARIARKLILATKALPCYQMLLALREGAPDVYKSIDDDTKARILTQALWLHAVINDWCSSDSEIDLPAGKAMIELGPKAIPYLLPMLSSPKSMGWDMLMGTEGCGKADEHGFTTAELAYRYIKLATGQKPEVLENWFEKAQACDELREELKKKGWHPKWSLPAPWTQDPQSGEASK